MNRTMILVFMVLLISGCSTLGVFEDQLENNPFVIKKFDSDTYYAYYFSIAMSKDGYKIYASQGGTGADKIKIWDLKNKEKKSIDASKWYKLKLNEKSGMLIAYDENAARLYSLNDYSLIKKIKYEIDEGFKLTNPNFDVEITADGKYLFTARGPELRMYNIKTWEKTYQEDVGDEGQISLLQTSGDGKILAVYGYIGKRQQLQIYKITDGKLSILSSMEIASSLGYISKMIFTRDSKSLIVIGGGYSVDSELYKGNVKMSTYYKCFGTVRKINLANNEIRTLISEDNTYYYSGDIDEKNVYLAVGKDKGITIHKLDDCEEFKKIKIEQMNINSQFGAQGKGNIIFSSNGKRILNAVSGGNDHRVMLFNNPWNFDE